MIFPKDPLENLAYTARRSGLWVPTPLKFARRCCCEPCEQCSGPMPSSYEVTVSGFVNGPWCAHCDEFNNTFILDDESLYPGRELCSRRYLLSIESCNLTPYVELWFCCSIGSIRGGIYAPGSIYYWKNYGSKPPCALENYELPYSGHSGFWGPGPSNYCDATGSKMVVTAL